MRPGNIVDMPEETTWPGLLTELLARNDLRVADAEWAMAQVMAGEVTPAQLAGFLVALRTKGETIGEIVGFRDAILSAARPLNVDPMALDIVGTGGDRTGTVNISTTAAIVAAAAGARVIKHGNRAASSASGSSDVLAYLGINLNLEPKQVAAVLDQTGITFAYAALFHPGFKNAAAVRSELGVPTVFNYLGPLCNPARPEASAVGVADIQKIPLMVGVFASRGASALVFRGDDGLDELSTTGHSRVWEISRGAVTEHDLNPQDLGIPRARIDQLRGGSPKNNAQILRRVLAGERGPIRDIVILNAAAGLVAWHQARDHSQTDRDIRERFRSALNQASEAVDSGAANKKLEQWIHASNALKIGE